MVIVTRLVGLVIEPLDQLAQASQRQQRHGFAVSRRSGGAGIIGPTHRHGAVHPVGQTHDEVGIGTAADAQDLNPLLIQRMVGMGDGDESRSGLG